MRNASPTSSLPSSTPSHPSSLVTRTSSLPSSLVTRTSSLPSSLVSRTSSLVHTLTREILGGKFVPLGAFPSERTLATRFGVSRQTIRNVIRELNRRGLIYSRQGRGTFLTRSAANLHGSIGLILTGERRTEIGREIREELERLTRRMGLTLSFGDASSLDPRAGARAAVRLACQFAAAKVSGVILQPVEFLPDAEKINARIFRALAKAHIPVVLIDCDIVRAPDRSDCDVIGIDNFGAGRRLAEHLKAAGAANVTFLAQSHYPDTVADRLRGIESVFSPSPSSLVTRTSSLPSSLVTCPSSLSPSSIYRAFLRRDRPDAVVCQNDIAAVNALAAFRLRKWRVPEDVLLAGFDDVAYAPLAEPSLTTVRQPCKHIAARAFDQLWARIGKSKIPTARIELGAELVIRRSTSRP